MTLYNGLSLIYIVCGCDCKLKLTLCTLALFAILFSLTLARSFFLVPALQHLVSAHPTTCAIHNTTNKLQTRQPVTGVPHFHSRCNTGTYENQYKKFGKMWKVMFWKIISAKVVLAKDGTSFGCGYMNFKNFSGAYLTIQNSNGIILNGQQILSPVSKPY